VIEGEAGLKHYWRLDDAPAPANVQAMDSAPAMQLAGTYNGTVARVPGVLPPKQAPLPPGDRASSFDGSTGYVEVGYNALLNPPDDFTIEAWIKPNLTPPNQVQPNTVVAVVDSYEPKPEHGFVLEVRSDNVAALTARVRVGNGSKFRPLETQLGAALNGWYHLVATYNRAADTLKLYVNAGLKAQLPNTTDTKPVAYLATDPNAGPLRIGAGQVEAGATQGFPAAFFPGVIDEVALYNVALDAQSIGTHFTLATTP
jgi:hypothetical protein